jgi:hypothetical protein
MSVTGTRRKVRLVSATFADFQSALSLTGTCAARMTEMALTAAIGAQVVLGALTTGLAAATHGRTSSIIVSVFGGASTCVATYLARVRGSGEPEISKQRERDLNHFLREVDAVILDKGYVVGVRSICSHRRRDGCRRQSMVLTDELQKLDDNGEHIRDSHDSEIDKLRQRLEILIGNTPDNSTP